MFVTMIYAYVETFSTAFISLPFVMFSYMQIVRFHAIYMYIMFFRKLTKQLRRPSFSSYTHHVTSLVDCSNTVILAEQSLHHNIILEKLDHR